MKPDAAELAEILWATNVPGAPPLPEQADETRFTYYRAAEAAISWFAAIEEERGTMRVAMRLAEELAWKLNNPMQFADSVREAFEEYVTLVGEDRLGPEIRKAMEI